jgi:3-oxoacyl-[acyl-carrier protein] reductase
MTFQVFDGKAAIVTGAGTGIGFAIAKYLVEHGATVVLNDYSAEAAEAAVTELNQIAIGRALPYVGDASQVDFIREMVAYAADLPDSQLEIAVANAGLTEFGRFLDFSERSFDRVVDLNLKGTFFLAQAVARRMKAQKSGGRIVLIGSNVGNRAYPNLAAYGMSKAGIAMLAQHLTLDLGPYGITVNCVSPGATLTDRTAQEEPDYAGVWSLLNPNGRVGMPEDVAAAVGFILSPAARHISGQQLMVDGGWTGYAPSPFFVDQVLDDAKKEVE